jgi:hypothetical protein
MPGAEFTHPDCASLVGPLFACGVKRVKKLLPPSFPLAEERVNERSDVRVSRYRSEINANDEAKCLAPR